MPGAKTNADDGDDISSSDGTHPTSPREPDGPDEVQEIRKHTQRATNRVKYWRALTTFALIATGISVTAATYTLLLKQEDENFRIGVS